MKKFIFLLAAATGILFVHAQSDKTPFMTKSLSNEVLQKVHVETSGGSIAVTGGNASDARIEVFIRGNGGINNNLSKAEIEKRLNEDYTLDIDVKNHELIAIAKSRNKNLNWKKSLSISFKIYVTNKIDTKLSTSGGSITIGNLTGNQDFSTSGGSLTVSKVSGSIDGHTSGGSITLKDANGAIDLSTSGGSINSTNAEGNIKLRTSGGSLSLHDMKGTINAITSGGSIEGDDIEGELVARTSGGSINLKELACSLETSTSGGHIAVEIEELGKYIKIENSGGNIALQMPANKGINLELHASKINVDKITNFSGKQDNDKMVGTLNGGGVPVEVRAGSGRITLALN